MGAFPGLGFFDSLPGGFAVAPVPAWPASVIEEALMGAGSEEVDPAAGLYRNHGSAENRDFIVKPLSYSKIAERDIPSV